MLIRWTMTILAAVGVTFAQGVESGSHEAVWVGAGPGLWTGTMALHGSDIRFEGAPVQNAPYSAEAVTEVVQTLADGNRIRHENRTVIHRDSQGRTRREEKLQAVGPWATGPKDAAMIFINDNVAGVHWVLNPREKTARKMPVPRIEDLRTDVWAQRLRKARTTADESVEFEENVVTATRTEPGGPLQHNLMVRRASGPFAGDTLAGPAAGGELDVEELGVRDFEGVQARGVRQTRTIKAGQIGNERPIEVVFEQWRSEELGVTLMSRRSDPRSGVTTYELKNIQRTEPSPALFEPPPDYTVVEGPAFNVRRSVETKIER